MSSCIALFILVFETRYLTDHQFDETGQPVSPRDHPVSVFPGCSFYMDAGSPNSDLHVPQASTLPAEAFSIPSTGKFTFDEQSVRPELVTITSTPFRVRVSNGVRTLIKLSLIGRLHHLQCWREGKNDAHILLTA